MQEVTILCDAGCEPSIGEIQQAVLYTFKAQSWLFDQVADVHEGHTCHIKTLLIVLPQSLRMVSLKSMPRVV
ncbi:hypothetical protein DSECCO2_568680 [anaerobic digester metagenome]